MTPVIKAPWRLLRRSAPRNDSHVGSLRAERSNLGVAGRVPSVRFGPLIANFAQDNLTCTSLWNKGSMGKNLRAPPVSLVRHLHNFGSSGGARFWRHAFLADTRKLRIATIELPYSHYIYTGIGNLSGCGIVVVGVGAP